MFMIRLQWVGLNSDIISMNQSGKGAKSLLNKAGEGHYKILILSSEPLLIRTSVQLEVKQEQIEIWIPDMIV